MSGLGFLSAAAREELEELIDRRVQKVLDHRLGDQAANGPGPYLTIPEAAELLRCGRQRIDDLLSQRRLSRFKDGSRTLVSRAEVESYLSGAPGVSDDGEPPRAERADRRPEESGDGLGA